MFLSTDGDNINLIYNLELHKLELKQNNKYKSAVRITVQTLPAIFLTQLYLQPIKRYFNERTCTIEQNTDAATYANAPFLLM